MSIPLTELRSSAPTPFWLKPPALLAVVVARVLGRRTPARLRSALLLLRRGARQATVGEVRRARDAVLSVSVRCGGEWCLERSVAIAVLCRLRGVWPEWCTGVRTEPFQAHAWVAVGGVPVEENPHLMPYFRVVMRVPPSGMD